VHNLSVALLRASGTYADSKSQADYLRRVSRRCGLALRAVKQATGGWVLYPVARDCRSRRRRRPSDA
jgi:hypothetical protein